MPTFYMHFKNVLTMSSALLVEVKPFIQLNGNLVRCTRPLTFRTQSPPYNPHTNTHTHINTRTMWTKLWNHLSSWHCFSDVRRVAKLVTASFFYRQMFIIRKKGSRWGLKTEEAWRNIIRNPMEMDYNILFSSLFFCKESLHIPTWRR